jgi:hypothetical protein
MQHQCFALDFPTDSAATKTHLRGVAMHYSAIRGLVYEFTP